MSNLINWGEGMHAPGRVSSHALELEKREGLGQFIFSGLAMKST
jgi:hypothetical protein